MKKQVLKFVPENLNLDHILEAEPPAFEYDRNVFVYILNLLFELPTYNKKYRTNSGYVPLNAQMLQSKGIKDYRRYLNYLIEHNVLECDYQYSPGEFSRKYRYTEKYRNNKVNPCYVDKSGIFKRSNPLINKDVRISTRHLTTWLESDLNINLSRANEILEYEFLTSNESFVKRVNKYNIGKVGALKIQNGEIFANRDSTSGRLHTNLTNLSSSLRPALTYQEKRIVNIDVVNAQPIFSTVLLEEYFWNTTLNKPLNYKHIHSANQLHTLASIMLSKIDKVSNYQDVKHYIQAARSGTFYESLQSLFLSNGLIKKPLSRKGIKGLMFTVMFSDNENSELWPNMIKLKQMFNELFPNVSAIFELIKAEEPNLLAVTLQSIESELILNRITKKITHLNRRVPLLTIHDSVGTTLGNESFISSVMSSELEKNLGFECKLKNELW